MAIINNLPANSMKIEPYQILIPYNNGESSSYYKMPDTPIFSSNFTGYMTCQYKGEAQMSKYFAVAKKCKMRLSQYDSDSFDATVINEETVYFEPGYWYRIKCASIVQSPYWISRTQFFIEKGELGQNTSTKIYDYAETGSPYMTYIGANYTAYFIFEKL